MNDDITNKQLAISDLSSIAAVWVTVVGAVILGGIAWGKAEADIGETKIKADANGVKIEAIQQDIGTIKTDVEVTKNEVKNLSGKLDDFMRKQDAELDRFLHERETEQQEILRLLRQRQ